MKRSNLFYIVLALGLLVAVQLLTTRAHKEFYLTQMIMAAYYSLVVMGLCLVMGYAGQVSMGHGAFFAMGGYTSALLTTIPISAAAQSGWGRVLQKAGLLVSRPDIYGSAIITASPWAAFIAALLLTAIVASMIGYPALRLKGHYLAMATLGFGLIVYRLVLGSSFTGASDGLQGVPPWHLGFGLTVCGAKAQRIANYYVAWALALGVLVVLLNLVHSRVGRALRSIHDGELAANAMGVDTAGYKFKAFLLSALLAATAGSFMTHYNGGIGPSEAGAMKSVRYVALVAAGGMANLWGALIVSVVLNYLSLRGYFGTYDHAVFGIILILMVSLAPEGPLKAIRDFFFRRRETDSRAGGTPHGVA